MMYSSCPWLLIIITTTAAAQLNAAGNNGLITGIVEGLLGDIFRQIPILTASCIGGQAECLIDIPTGFSRSTSSFYVYLVAADEGMCGGAQSDAHKYVGATLALDETLSEGNGTLSNLFRLHFVQDKPPIGSHKVGLHHHREEVSPLWSGMHLFNVLLFLSQSVGDMDYPDG